ncbi:tyrosine-type recombinase/integrase [Tolypothrix sp. VBCCA 56010]|uniref:tyrosine-type recombinase/integrase n=1 Tax=Tolypothrix sp. VBCCA 56010 TaxID=3137731 RepID=UPI003D7EC1B1
MSIYKPKSRAHLKLVVNNPIPESKQEWKLRRPKNEDVRSREYLRPDEVERLIEAAKSVGRYPGRDGLLMLMMYRHGLRVSEAIALRWSDVDWDTAHIYIKRLKRGNPSNQQIDGKELRLLRSLKREAKDKSPWMFMSERGSPLTDDAVRKIISRAGEIAGFDFPIHPHMLRHSCGYYLASRGYDTRLIQDYLGHKNIQHTVKYTQLAPGRFDGLWD